MTDYPGAAVEAADADGAFQIGGGSYNFGQKYNEQIIRSMFSIPAPTPGTALNLLRQQLERLPLDVLRQFQSLLPAPPDAWNSVQGAVNAITNALTDVAKFLGIDQWDDWLLNVFNHLSTELRQMIDILGGAIVTPINAAVAAVQDWWVSVNVYGQNLTVLIQKLLANPAEVIGSIPQTLVNGLSGALGNLQSMINQFGDIVNGLVVTPITQAVANFQNWFLNLIGFQRETSSTQINLQNFAISAVTSTARNPTWVCRYPIGDVVYPEYMNAQYEVYGFTDGQSAGTAHTHTLSLNNRAYSDAAGWSVLQNQSRGSYITISNSTVIDTMGMMLWKEGTTALNNVFMELFRENVDGSITRLVSVDVSSLITTSTTYVETSIPGQIVQAGERYLIRLRNASTTNPIVRSVSMTLTDAMVQGQFYTSTAATSGKSSYTAAECSTARGASMISPWGLLAAKNLPLTDQSFSDDFNRSAMGGLWSLITVIAAGSAGPQKNLAIVNGKCVSTGSITDGGALFKGTQSAVYVRPTNGDAQRVDGNVYPATSSQFHSGLAMHCSRDGSQAVVLAVANNRVAIWTGSLTAVSMTERKAVAGGGAGLYSMYYDAPRNTYVVLKNGEPIGLEWTDTDNVVQHGRDFRYGGVRHGRELGLGSGPIDNWTLRDWQPPMSDEAAAAVA
ncbi:hypothetical protein [Mycolicibacterium aichiense]|uniref:Uncharacterized protein n=1 Tax=Mycolicibacterium aichiense TaxID=1799 RepID=A0A378VE67_9MYCO|nr:hypothetical protein [Mycolicibacterium aichiense]QFG07999.1 hypothetical protein SEA_HERBERTWM_29 [Mycobacterium phage Herbertwm]MCV7016713.1 hypothetical protein [Mycolicibacterium aichiense]SUA14072.1 Uncharacterised protein [Mycolicibacterium aichiense]SUA14431.1 Uncharacterised protein [Mycolicibacterium aichiense]BBX09507.1 hypothetical protein MAIC_43100 [Mycolicibacterium aichiense]